MYVWKFTDIGEGIHEGKVAEVNFKEGDTINDGDTLFTVETDKMNAEMPAPATGKLAKLNIKVGQVIHVGDVVCEIDDGTGASAEAPKAEAAAPAKEEAPAEEAGASVVGEVKVSNEVKTFGQGTVQPKDEAAAPAAQEPEMARPITTAAPKSKKLATPSARALAAKLGVDLNDVNGTGHNGRIMKSDIHAALKNVNTAIDSSNHSMKQAIASDVDVQIPAGKRTETIPMTTMRKAISRNMVLSKSTIPHAYITHEIDLTQIVAARKQIKDVVFKTHGVKITFLAYILKAIAVALKEYPIMNASADVEKGTITLKNYVNIGIAADTPAGLVVPVIRDVDKRSIIDIARDVSVLGKKAVEGKLTGKDMSDGTFTLSNFGSVGAAAGFSIIKPGEVGIMGMGAIKKTPVFGKDDQIIAKHILNLSTSMDHRIIDGAVAARFANKVKELLENPSLLTVL